MTLDKDMNIISQAKSAVSILMRHYRHGDYRAIRDPEGIVGLWSIESGPNAPFTISFVEKGRVYNNIEDVPNPVLMSFIEYVRKTVKW